MALAIGVHFSQVLALERGSPWSGAVKEKNDMAARASAAPDTVLIRTGAGGSVIGRIKNLSNGVVHVLLPEVIPEGSLVDVEISAHCAVSGEVMYCSPYQTSFNAAIYFESDGNRRFRSMPRFEVREAAMVDVMNCPART